MPGVVTTPAKWLRAPAFARPPAIRGKPVAGLARIDSNDDVGLVAVLPGPGAQRDAGGMDGSRIEREFAGNAANAVRAEQSFPHAW